MSCPLMQRPLNTALGRAHIDRRSEYEGSSGGRTAPGFEDSHSR